MGPSTVARCDNFGHGSSLEGRRREPLAPSPSRRRYSERMPLDADNKDWTWVLERRCPECGFDAAAVSRANVADAVRQSAEAWRNSLHGEKVRTRPRDDRWSTLEYGCHVRDVFRIFDVRLGLMLDHDNPEFESWDQDAAAVSGDYDTQEPTTVARELVEAGWRYGDRLGQVRDDQWLRAGRRSNGSRFTVESLATYSLHDLVHHLWDVRGQWSDLVALS